MVFCCCCVNFPSPRYWKQTKTVDARRVAAWKRQNMKPSSDRCKSGYRRPSHAALCSIYQRKKDSCFHLNLRQATQGFKVQVFVSLSALLLKSFQRAIWSAKNYEFRLEKHTKFSRISSQTRLDERLLQVNKKKQFLVFSLCNERLNTWLGWRRNAHILFFGGKFFTLREI